MKKKPTFSHILGAVKAPGGAGTAMTYKGVPINVEVGITPELTGLISTSLTKTLASLKQFQNVGVTMSVDPALNRTIDNSMNTLKIVGFTIGAAVIGAAVVSGFMRYRYR